MMIFCCGMPRSGGTLLYQLTKEIAALFDLAEGKGFAKSSYRNGVVKSEPCNDWMLERVRQGDALAIGTYRDYRDIIVSLTGFYNRRSITKHLKSRWTVQEVIEREGRKILDDYYRWNRVCTRWFRYEIELPGVALDEIPGLLGVSLSPVQKNEIAVKYNLRHNLKRIQSQTVWMDTGTMLTAAHISETGGRSTWAECLTPDEVAMIERLAGKWLAEHNYDLSTA